MEEIVSKLKKGLQIKKTTSPLSWSARDLVEFALKNSATKDLGSMLLEFDRLMQDKDATLHRLPEKESGSNVGNGIVEKVNVYREPHGLHCTNPAHQGSVCNVNMDDLICEICHVSGAPLKSLKKKWSLPTLMPLLTTCPVFFVVLVSRSSSGRPIPQEVFDSLRKSVISNKKKILAFLKTKTNIDYEIHIIEEVGHNGSILSLLSDSDKHVRSTSAGEGLHLPACHISDLFFYHSTNNSMVGYMSNAPGDLNGKFSNHVYNLKHLQRGGIEPSSVVYMAYGVHIQHGFGVVDNFTIFTGDELLNKIKHYISNNCEGIPHSEEPTVDGYLCGMIKDAGTRLLRNSVKRKSQIPKNINC